MRTIEAYEVRGKLLKTLVILCMFGLLTLRGVDAQVISGGRLVGITDTQLDISFLCADHATDDAHDFQIIEDVTDVVQQTLALGDPALVAGRVTTSQMISNLKPGVYYGRVRTSTGGSPSAYSSASVTWKWN